MDDFIPATRTIGNNAKGNKIRVGSGQISSLDSSEVAERASKKARNVDTANARASGPDSVLPTLPGVGAFLQDQRLGAKGIRAKIKNASFEGDSLQVSFEDYEVFCNSTKQSDPNGVHFKAIERLQESQNPNKLWLLLSDHNVLLYGLGCKRRVIESLVTSCLQGEDVVELNVANAGSSSSGAVGNDRCIKELLSHITHTVLKHKGSLEACSVSLVHQTRILADLLNIHYGRGSLVSGAGHTEDSYSSDLLGVGGIGGGDAAGRKRSSRAVVADSERWGGRYALAQSKLYIVVHDICGAALCSETTQQCLAVLAECKSVALLATAENLNSVVHWDRRVLAMYCWSYHHVPTYEPSERPSAAFPLICRDLEAAVASAIKHAAEGAEEGEDDAGVDVDWDSMPVDSGKGSGSRGVAISSDPAKSNGVSLVGSSVGSSNTNNKGQGGGHQESHQPPRAQAVSASTNSMAGRSLAALTDSVTANHNGLIQMLVRAIKDKKQRILAQRAAESDSSASSGRNTSRRATATHTAEGKINHEGGVQIEALLQLGKAAIIVKDMKGLRNLLKEFIDHSVVTIISHNGQEYVCLKPPFDTYLG